jgi:hypothetical protein
MELLYSRVDKSSQMTHNAVKPRFVKEWLLVFSPQVFFLYGFTWHLAKLKARPFRWHHSTLQAMFFGDIKT